MNAIQALSELEKTRHGRYIARWRGGRRRGTVGVLHDEEEGEDEAQSVYCTMKRREKTRHNIPDFDNADDQTYWSVTSSDRAMAQVAISRSVTTGGFGSISDQFL